MLNKLLETNEWNQFEPENFTFDIDRGFRNSLNRISRKGFIDEMLPFLEKHRKMLTTQQVNQSRLITKSRYIDR